MGHEVEAQVARHYDQTDLERTILDALAAAGKDLDRLKASDLAPIDEFHIGGREATVELTRQMALRPGLRLLDVGCGFGGASRYVAETHGCAVTGIDLTPSYVATATALARRVGLADRVTYRQASALELPFEAGSFDGAYMIHVGMNIEAKPRLFAEIRRVLKPGGVFAVYDVMRAGEGALRFPVPWATTPETSFVEPLAAYRAALEDAGFTVSAERSRAAFAVEFFRRMHAAAAGGPPALGIHVFVPDFPRKRANMLDNLEEGLIAPVEMIARAR